MGSETNEWRAGYEAGCSDTERSEAPHDCLQRLAEITKNAAWPLSLLSWLIEQAKVETPPQRCSQCGHIEGTCACDCDDEPDECERPECVQIRRTASEVYCELTGGKLSYPTYEARTLISEANDYTQRLIDEETAELRAENRRLADRVQEMTDDWAAHELANGGCVPAPAYQEAGDAADAAEAKAADLQAKLDNAGRALAVMQGHEIRADAAEAKLAAARALIKPLNPSSGEWRYGYNAALTAVRDALWSGDGEHV